VSGQGSSKEAPVGQAEQAIIEYLKGDLRGSLGLAWHLALEDLSLARRVKVEWDETPGSEEVADAVLPDLAAASEACYIAVNILDDWELSELVSKDADRYWNLLSDIINGLIELRDYLTMALSIKDFDFDRAKGLSPVIKEKVEELFRNIISELSSSVVRLENKIDDYKRELDVCKLDLERLAGVSGSGQADS
jgi:hypothetical protein